MSRLLVTLCIVAASLVACSGGAGDPAPRSTAWTTARIVVYKKNSPTSGRVIVLQRNVRVKVSRCHAGWCHVRHGRHAGWVRASELIWHPR